MVVINTLNYWKVCKLLLKNFSRLIERCNFLDLRSSTCTQSWTMVVINILDHRKAHKLRQSQDFRCRDSIETRLELAIHRLGASQSSCPRTGLAKIRPTSTSRSSWWVSSMHRTIGRSKLSCFWSFLKSKILDNPYANSGYDSGFWCQYDHESAAGLRALEAEICYQMVNDDCACT